MLVTGIGSALSLSAGDYVTFTLQARDQYGNPYNADGLLSAIASEEGAPSPPGSRRRGGRPVTSWFQALGDGLFNVSFYVTQSGVWTLDIMLDGVVVSSGPVLLSVAPGPVAPAHCSAVGPGLSSAIATAVANFTVTVRDVYDNAFLDDAGLTIDFNRGPQPITAVISNNTDGVYDVYYTPVKMGNYNIAVRVNVAGALRPIAGSPFPLNVQAGPVDATHCNTSGTGTTGFNAGTPVWFAVTARDIFNNIVSDTDPTIFNVNLQKGSSSVPVTLQAVANQKGTFNASFTLTETGAWTLQVTLASDGKDVMGSPFALQIASASEPLLSLCNITDYNGGLVGGAAGSPVGLMLIARDAYGNLMTNQVYFSVAVTLTTNASVTATAVTEFQPPGMYIFLYTIEVVGTYTVAVQYLGQSLPGSPWTVSFTPGPSSGLGSYVINFPGHLSEKEVGNFMIQVADRYGNNQTNNNDSFAFTVTRKGASNSTYAWPFQVVSSNRSDGFYYVVFGPADRRGSFLVNVRLIAPTLEPLMHSPYAVEVSWGLSALQIALIGMGLAAFVLLLMLGMYLYRKVVVPWRKRRRYEQILADSDNRAAPAAPAAPKAP